MKVIKYIFLLCLCWACRQDEPGFMVKGKIEGYPGTKLFVREMIPDNKMWMNDTLEVVNGEFVYTGKVESPRLIYFIPENFQGRYELFLENSSIGLKGKYGIPEPPEINGSKSHDEFRMLKRKSAGLLCGYNSYRNRLSEAMKTDQGLYVRLADSSEIWSARLLSFLKEQPDYARSEVLPYFAQEWIKAEDIGNMEAFLSGLTGPARTSVYTRYCERSLQQEKRVLPGKEAYNFTLQDTTGRKYCLSDYRGQYVLLEFSASWCGWCKLEIPYLKRVHELTHNKKLAMFTVNLDKERKLWVEDVAKENLPWPVISDLQAFDGELTRQYNVSGIPVIFLIDPEGKIVTNKLRGEQMIEYISRLMEIPSDTTTEKR